MTPERFHKLKGCFQRALALTGDAREVFFRALQDSESDLVEPLKALLAAHEAGTRVETIEDVKFISQSAGGSEEDDDLIVVSGSSTDSTSDDDTFPGYTILERISEGGQGVVYLAVQRDTKRQVAIKVLLAGVHASKKALARFEREIELAARLSHPHIVSIFHAGTAADGRSFFVMDYIRGLPLTAYVRGKALSLDDTLVLFGKVCEAVLYAHQRGIIHRDLKPSNILVDVDGHPKILDFGLAKLIDGSDETAATLSQQVMGTLPYMSPEQTRGNPDEIDTRTDVYALGVILYEMLTGHYPYPVTGHMAEVLKHIAETEPTPPSRAWKADTGVHLGKPSSRMRRSSSSPIDDEIQTIVLKSLSKERERRYQSAGELARDVERYLANDPIEAKRDSAWYVLRKAAGRYRVQFAVAASFVLLLAAATVTTVIQWRQTLHQRDIAENEWRRAEDAEADATRREYEAVEARDNLKKVAEFQASMLADVDPEAMGQRLRDDLLADAKSVMLRMRFDEADVTDRLEQLEKLLAGTNFTNMARNAIDSQILEPAVAATETDFDDQPLVQADLQQTLSSIYIQFGMYRSALPLLQAALDTYRNLLGPEHPNSLSTFREMGNLMLYMGNLTEAERILQESLNLRTRLLGSEHRMTISAINDWVDMLMTKKQYGEVESKIREAVSKASQFLGDEDEITIESMGTLGVLLNATGRNFESQYYLSEALALARKVLGEDHHFTLTILSNLISTLTDNNRTTEAGKLCAELLIIRRKTMGDVHPETLLATNKLGGLLFSTGHYAEAERNVRAAMDIRRRVLGNNHPQTLRSIHNTGAMLKWLGRTEESIAYHREALEGERRIFGGDNPETIRAMINLAFMLRESKQYAEAETVSREALTYANIALADNHQNTGNAAFLLGSVIRSMGRLTEGELYLRESLRIFRAELGFAHRSTVASIIELGYTMHRSGRLTESEHLFRTAVETARHHFKDAPNVIGGYMHSLGRCLGAQRKFDEAESTLLESHRVLELAFGPEHSSVVTTMKSIAEFYDLWSTKESNETAEQKAQEWRKRLPVNRRSE